MQTIELAGRTVGMALNLYALGMLYDVAPGGDVDGLTLDVTDFSPENIGTLVRCIEALEVGWAKALDLAGTEHDPVFTAGELALMDFRDLIPVLNEMTDVINRDKSTRVHAVEDGGRGNAGGAATEATG